MSESSEALKAAKIQRRSAKAALTRLGKARWTDEQFEQEEQWLDECQTFFLKLDIHAKCYIEYVSAKISKSSLEKNPQNSSGMIGMQNTPSASNTSHEISEPSVSNENNLIDISTPQENPIIKGIRQYIFYYFILIKELLKLYVTLYNLLKYFDLK
jgi:hypothetical protein